MRRDQIKKKTVRSTKKREIGLVKNGSTEPSLRMRAWTREVSKVLKAEGICFSHFFLNVSKNSKAFCLDEA